MHIFLNLSNDAAFGHLSGLADGVVDGLGVEEPWALMTGLEMPMKAVPPTLLGSSWALKARSPGITMAAASLVSRFFRKMSPRA